MNPWGSRLSANASSAFISYSREDSEFALRLANDLKAAGARVWFDQTDIIPGHPWDDAIEEALNDSPQMLVILSPLSAKSKNVRNEISYALGQGKIIVPVLYKDCVAPLNLQRFQHIDFRSDYARGLAQLLDHLRVANPDPAVLQKAAAADAQRQTAWQAREVEARHLRTLTEQQQRDQAEAPAAAAAKHAAGFRPSKMWIPASAVLLVVVAVAGAYLYFHHSRKVLTEADTVVLADFTNSTGDPVFDGTLRQGMTVQLEQSPFLSLVSDERIQKTLALMAQPPDAHLTPAIGREVCERTGSAAVLDGTIAPLGAQYVLGLRAIDCRTGEALDVEQVQAARKEDVLNALSEMASRLRSRLGESLATVKQFDTPLAEATTPSLEALKTFSAAAKIHFTADSAAAQPLYKRAIELDPNFAIAYSNLGQTYGELGESDLSADYIAKAYALRDHASDAEKFFIAVSYDIRVTGNLEDAQQQCEAWAQAYPREPRALGLPAGIIDLVFGKYEESVEDGKKAVELDPDLRFSTNNLAGSYILVGRLDDAESVLRQAADRKVQTDDSMEYEIAFLRGDQAGMEREIARAQAASKLSSEFLVHEAFAMAYSGRLQQAREMSQRALDIAQQSGQRERAAGFESAAAVREAFFANADAAGHEASAALADSKDREAEYGAAFALALAGDSARAQVVTDDLEKRFPQDTCVRFDYVPELRALLALNRNDPAKAIEQLQVAAPYELGVPRSSFHAFFGKLYPAYVRGLAYLASHRGVEAAAEFQKILDHPSIVTSDPVGALARLQIARAYAMSGDTVKARVAYQNFLTLWKDADPDIPILLQAKAESAKLQ
jgi:tetratricopeptide (TPR) repeat protein